MRIQENWHVAIKQQLKCKTKQNKKPTTKSAISIYLKSLPCPVVLLTTHTMQYAVCALEICVSTNTILPKKYFFFSHSLQKKITKIVITSFCMQQLYRTKNESFEINDKVRVEYVKLCSYFFISWPTLAVMISFQQEKERIELQIHFRDCILMLCKMGCTLCKLGCYPIAFGFLCKTKKMSTKTLHSH